MTASCHRATHLAYCDAIGDVVERTAAVLGGLDPEARVPTCPDWSVGDLAAHVGTVHRWAANMVEVLAPRRIPSATMAIEVPDDAAARGAWVADGGPVLVERLRSQDPDAAMWAWGADRHVRFWSRRMMHETTVHRADAEFAAAAVPRVEDAVATDGIDEFLDNLPHAEYFAPRVAELRGIGERIALAASDAATTWTITLAEDGFSWNHDHDAADATIEATAEDLYLMIWGRRRIGDGARFRVTGERALVERWVERSAI